MRSGSMQWALLCWLLAAAVAGPGSVSGQGLPLPGKPGLAARDYSRVRTWAAEGVQWRASYAADPAAACNMQAGLCAASPGSEDYGKLLVATSPADYDSRTAAAAYSPIGTVLDQRPCQSAVAFAVISAAEAAAASALHINASTISLSQQELQFCPDSQRTCQDSWDVRAAVDQLINGSIVSSNCLPYTAATTDDPAKLCNYRCRDQPKQLQGGRFRAVSVRSPLEGQRQIRRYGSFVTRFNIHPDFPEWLRGAAASDPNAVYDCLNSAQPPVAGHAVAVIGYNNTEGAWIVKNSWGTSNGDKGVFKVRYGVCGMLAPGDTLGLSFIPAQPLPLQVEGPLPDPQPASASESRTCYKYMAQPGDFVSKVADAALIRVGQLLLDNNSTLKDLDKPLAGTQLLLCDPDPSSVTTGPVSKPATAAAAATAVGSTVTNSTVTVAPVVLPPLPAATTSPLVAQPLLLPGLGGLGGIPGASSSSSSSAAAAGKVLGPDMTGGPPTLFPEKAAEEAEALLAFAEALGFTHPDWQAGSEPCAEPQPWPHLYCNPAKRVYMIDLSSKGLKGALGDEVDLEKLPYLQALWLYDNPSLAGTLPTTWAEHDRLREVSLYGCSLTGPLPSSWGRIKRLRRLYLHNNKLSGPLPAEWGSLSALQNLGLATNEFTGTIPESWSGMRSLKSISLFDNTGLYGCVPPDWLTRDGRRVSLARPTEGIRPLAGTKLCRSCTDTCKAGPAAAGITKPGRIEPPVVPPSAPPAGVVQPTVPSVTPFVPPVVPLVVPPVGPAVAAPGDSPQAGVPSMVPAATVGSAAAGPNASAVVPPVTSPSPSPSAGLSPNPSPKPSPSPSPNPSPSPSPSASPGPAAAAAAGGASKPGDALERGSAPGTPANPAAAGQLGATPPSKTITAAAAAPVPDPASPPTAPAPPLPSPVPVPTPIGSLPVPIDPSKTVIPDNRKPNFQDVELSGNRRLMLHPHLLLKQRAQ